MDSYGFMDSLAFGSVAHAWGYEQRRASLFAVAIVFCASQSVMFVFRDAKLRAQSHPSKFGLNFQTHTDSLSDGQKVGPKVLVQHPHANEHWKRDAPAPRSFNVETLNSELAL